MFYKVIDDELMFGPFVTFPDGFMLHKDDLQSLNLPYEGWHYFETEEEAKNFFQITE